MKLCVKLIRDVSANTGRLATLDAWWVKLNGCRAYFWQRFFMQEYSIKRYVIVLPNFVIAI